jgi:hypothetical protein
MKIGPIAQVTMLSSDIAKSVQLYSQAFGWDKTNYLEVTSAQAQSWGADLHAGADLAIVGGVSGSVRFIECNSYPEQVALKTFGWTALEVCVDDVYGYTDRAIAAGFKMLNEPVKLAGSANPLPLIAAQLAGPNGECIYITQILGDVPNFELPDVSTHSGSIFICVLGASDLAASREVLESKFQLRRASDREVAIKVLNKVYDMPLTDLHHISSLQLNGRNAIEIDQLPTAASARAKLPGYLPPGISIVSVKAEVTSPTIISLPDNALLELIA